jgi:hypothetical protein
VVRDLRVHLRGRVDEFFFIEALDWLLHQSLFLRGTIDRRSIGLSR